VGPSTAAPPRAPPPLCRQQLTAPGRSRQLEVPLHEPVGGAGGQQHQAVHALHARADSSSTNSSSSSSSSSSTGSGQDSPRHTPTTPCTLPAAGPPTHPQPNHQALLAGLQLWAACCPHWLAAPTPTPQPHQYSAGGRGQQAAGRRASGSLLLHSPHQFRSPPSVQAPPPGCCLTCST